MGCGFQFKGFRIEGLGFGICVVGLGVWEFFGFGVPFEGSIGGYYKGSHKPGSLEFLGIWGFGRSGFGENRSFLGFGFTGFCAEVTASVLRLCGVAEAPGLTRPFESNCCEQESGDEN